MEQYVVDAFTDDELFVGIWESSEHSAEQGPEIRSRIKPADHM